MVLGFAVCLGLRDVEDFILEWPSDVEYLESEIGEWTYEVWFWNYFGHLTLPEFGQEEDDENC